MMTRQEEPRPQQSAPAGGFWSDYFWQLYLGVGFIGTAIFAISFGSVVVNRSLRAQELVEDARTTSLVVLGISLFLAAAFVPSAWAKDSRKRLLLYGALPICLVLAAVQGLFLVLLALDPAKTELALGEHVLGSFPCTSQWDCTASVHEQERFWAAYAERHASAPDTPRVAGDLVRGLWAIQSAEPRAEAIQAVIRLYRTDPKRYLPVLEELSRRATGNEEAGQQIRESLRRENPAEQ